MRLEPIEALPEIGSRRRDADEAAALKYAAQLLHEENGCIRDALYRLTEKLVGSRKTLLPHQTRLLRDYARVLVYHVEQCWATRILG